MKRTTLLVTLAAIGAPLTNPAFAIDEEHYALGEQVIQRAISYLQSQQDPATGGWSVNPQGPQFPAITALVTRGLLLQPGISYNDPNIDRAVDYILSFANPDGSISDGVLASYNTSISLSALSKVPTCEATDAMEQAQSFLRSQQWGADVRDEGKDQADISPDHPFFGGIGYGRHGRPDLSNLGFMLEGLHDAGVSGNDTAFKNAVVFLRRTQMIDETNDMPYADDSSQGGFIYATSTNADNIGAGESKAGEIDESTLDGASVSRLRCYGSMTYVGFKSYIYADLSRDDPRVQAAYNWLRSNYTLEENPGTSMEGYYYYLMTFSRALDAWGTTTITTTDNRPHDWANDLVDKLADLQQPDGSFTVVDDRWMESNQTLITAYSLLALQSALR